MTSRSRSSVSSSMRRICCSTAASKAFVESVTQTVRLIRSKGVGVFFITQTPKDVDADVPRAAWETACSTRSEHLHLMTPRL